jgi:hypothetical protein
VVTDVPAVQRSPKQPRPRAGAVVPPAAALEGGAEAQAATQGGGQQQQQQQQQHWMVYPCNSVSRDVVIFMESRRPTLCNNQKKIWSLQGNLHHDTSLFQGRAWLQVS